MRLSSQRIDSDGVINCLLFRALEKIKIKGEQKKGIDILKQSLTEPLRQIAPTKVVRFALQNAASVSGLMLTTEVMAAIEPEKRKETRTPSGGMGEAMY